MGFWNAFECLFLPRLVLRIRTSVGILDLPLRPYTAVLDYCLSSCYLGIPILTVQECQSYTQFHIYFLSRICLRAFARFLILPEELHLAGGGGHGRVPNRIAILQDWAHQSFVSFFFYLLGAGI